MTVVTNKRSIMTLYSGAMDVYSHRVRIALAEKSVLYEIIHVEPRNKPERLFEINPYGSVPTLIDRDLALYEPNIIMEYLDERFPHPPLMPVYPVLRAKTRLVIYRFDREWTPIIRKLDSGKTADMKLAAKELTSYLVECLPIFNSSTYFLGDEFTLIDCCLAPILWRLPYWGVTLSPADNRILTKYANRLFQRDSFQTSLTDIERELRKTEKTAIA